MTLQHFQKILIPENTLAIYVQGREESRPWRLNNSCGPEHNPTSRPKRLLTIKINGRYPYHPLQGCCRQTKEYNLIEKWCIKGLSGYTIPATASLLGALEVLYNLKIQIESAIPDLDACICSNGIQLI